MKRLLWATQQSFQRDLVMYCTEDLDRALMDLDGNLVERKQMIERSDSLASWVLTSYQRDKT